MRIDREKSYAGVMIIGFRWSFFGISDANGVVSAGMTLGFLMLDER